MRALTSSVVLAAWLLVSSVASAEAGKPLTNQDVIDMVAAGLPESTILLSIKQSPASFSTSPQDLIALKKAGVSPVIMDAMMKAGSSSGAASTPSTGSESALIPTAYGQCAVAGGTLIPLPAISVDMVFGIALADIGVAVDGFMPTRAATLVEDPRAQFIVYAHDIDPNQIKLARLKLVETMTAWQFNAQGADPGPFQGIYGVSPSKVIDVNLLRVADPIGLRVEPVVGRPEMYRFIPGVPLERGESYALYLGEALHGVDYVISRKLKQTPAHAVFIRTSAPSGNSAGQGASGSAGLAAQAGPVLGRWAGRVAGWLPYKAVFDIRAGANGEVTGTAEYRASTPAAPFQCRTKWTLAEVDGTNYIFSEQVVEKPGECPVAGVVRLTVNDDGTGNVALFRRDSPDKIRYKGDLQKTN